KASGDRPRGEPRAPSLPAVLRDERLRDGPESLRADVGDGDGRRRGRVRVVALERAAVGRVVVALEEIRDERLPAAARKLGEPRLDAGAAVQRREAAQLLRERLRIGDEMRVVLEQQRDPRGLLRLEAEAARCAHALDQPLGHAGLPTLRLSDSTYTGRDGSICESAVQMAVSKDFCEGCGASG